MAGGPPPPAEGAPPPTGLFGRYNYMLATQPLLTKAVTSGVISMTGDVLAQAWHQQARERTRY